MRHSPQPTQQDVVVTPRAQITRCDVISNGEVRVIRAAVDRQRRAGAAALRFDRG